MAANTVSTKDISIDKREIIKNLYLSGIPKEFVAMQVDLDVAQVENILKELGITDFQ